MLLFKNLLPWWINFHLLSCLRRNRLSNSRRNDATNGHFQQLRACTSSEKMTSHCVTGKAYSVMYTQLSKVCRADSFSSQLNPTISTTLLFRRPTTWSTSFTVSSCPSLETSSYIYITISFFSHSSSSSWRWTCLPESERGIERKQKAIKSLVAYNVPYVSKNPGRLNLQARWQMQLLPIRDLHEWGTVKVVTSDATNWAHVVDL